MWGRWGEQEREERSAIRGPGAARLKGDEATLLNWVKEEEEEVEEGRSHSREQSQSSGFGERRKEGGEERFDTWKIIGGSRFMLKEGIEGEWNS